MNSVNKEQAKVSMVMPCYNKVEYIAEMLDSIIAQKWNNIELIMVNDGSTDGTREIIEQYLPKLKERGFNVLVIDQENAGVCAAAKNGLMKITGDYMCLVDCDDELDPSYVSTTVEFLEENPEYDYTACHFIQYLGVGKDKEFIPINLRPIEDGCPTVCEMYLMEQVVMPVWAYMVRTSYFRSCSITDSYYTETKGSHEPGYIIPLSTNGGKIKYFPLPLYRFNMNGEGHSRFTRFEQVENFYNEYHKLIIIALERLKNKVGPDRKERLTLLSAAHNFFMQLSFTGRLSINDEAVYHKILGELNQWLDENKLTKCIIEYEHLRGHWDKLINAIRNKILRVNVAKKPFIKSRNRIIGYGVLGKNGAKFLPILEDSAYEPTELWDQNGDGVIVKEPDFDSLDSKDVVIVFPSNMKIYNEVKKHAGTASVMRVSDIRLVDVIISKYELD